MFLSFFGTSSSSIIVAFNRLELAEERALSLTGQKTANECMDILKVITS